MATENVTTERNIINNSYVLGDLYTTMGSVGDSETGKGDWSQSSIYYPYHKGDVVYYYTNSISGSFLANCDTQVTPDDETNGYQFDYPDGHWTFLGNKHANTGILWPTPFNGKGNWGTENPSYPFSVGDVIHYSNGGLVASYYSLTNENTNLPDDGLEGFWQLLLQNS